MFQMWPVASHMKSTKKMSLSNSLNVNLRTRKRTDCSFYFSRGLLLGRLPAIETKSCCREADLSTFSFSIRPEMHESNSKWLMIDPPEVIMRPPENRKNYDWLRLRLIDALLKSSGSHNSGWIGWVSESEGKNRKVFGSKCPENKHTESTLNFHWNERR
jgi:hypothetical protein